MFTGREFDPESGLYYYRARYYDPSIGRFLQADPIKYYGGINLYRYVRNNPVRWRDPLGLSEIKAKLQQQGQALAAAEVMSTRPGAAVNAPGAPMIGKPAVGANELAGWNNSGAERRRHGGGSSESWRGSSGSSASGSEFLGDSLASGGESLGSFSNPLTDLPTFSESFPDSSIIAPTLDVVVGGIETGFAIGLGAASVAGLFAGPEFWGLPVLLGKPSIDIGLDAYSRIKAAIERLQQGNISCQ